MHFETSTTNSEATINIISSLSNNIIYFCELRITWDVVNMTVFKSINSSYRLFLYNFSTNKLDLISSQQITSVIIANLTNYINSSGYLYLAIQFISTINGDYTLTINNPTFIINNDLGFNPQTTYSNSLFEIETKKRNDGTPFQIGTSAIGSSYISSSKS